MQISGLLGPEMDQRMAAVLLQILGRGFQPGGVRSVRLLPAGGAGAERGGEVAQRPRNLWWRHREPVVGLGAEQGRRALDRIEAAHHAAVGELGRAALRHQVAAIGKMAGRGRNQIALDRKDDFGLPQIIGEIERAAESGLRGAQFLVPVERFPLVPAQCRELLLQRGDLRDQCRRRHRAGQQPQSGAVILAPGSAALDHRSDKCFPRCDLALMQDRLRAVRIIEREDARLHGRARRAAARRVVGISLDLHRPAGLMRHQHAIGIAALG